MTPLGLGKVLSLLPPLSWVLTQLHSSQRAQDRVCVNLPPLLSVGMCVHVSAHPRTQITCLGAAIAISVHTHCLSHAPAGATGSVPLPSQKHLDIDTEMAPSTWPRGSGQRLDEDQLCWTLRALSARISPSVSVYVTSPGMGVLAQFPALACGSFVAMCPSDRRKKWPCSEHQAVCLACCNFTLGPFPRGSTNSPPLWIAPSTLSCHPKQPVVGLTPAK